MEITLSASSKSIIRFGKLGGLPDLALPAQSVIVTDRRVSSLFGAGFANYRTILVPRGEAAKNIQSLEQLYAGFMDASIDRYSTVVGIGGGSISDLAGFAASTWLRGLRFGFVPTTLLAMVDAAVGGKNGIDFRGVKNLIGTIRQPDFVLVDCRCLETLSPVERSSGMAEAIKHAVIAGGDYFSVIGSAKPSDFNAVTSLVTEGAGIKSVGVVNEIVEGSIRIKARIVEGDEKESGERQLLNLGHTIGHGIEVVCGISHGHAVAAGLASIVRFSRQQGECSAAFETIVLDLLARWDLPASIDEAQAMAIEGGSTFASSNVSDAVTQSSAPARATGAALRTAIIEAMIKDKKRKDSTIVCAIPQDIGKVRLAEVSLGLLADFVRAAP